MRQWEAWSKPFGSSECAVSARDLGIANGGETQGQKMRHGLRVAGIAAAAGALAMGAVQARAELSEKSVTTLMNYAWIILPAKFTAPNGKTIEVDKKKQDAMVPVEVGREVIKAGNLSAQAQLCDMMEDQVANYHALMARERAKKTWTDQQLLYITTLHRMTIHMAAGKMRVVDKGPDEIQVFLEPIESSKDSCNDDKRKKVREAVETYVKGAPAVQPASGPPAPAQPVPASQPGPAPEKKAPEKKK